MKCPIETRENADLLLAYCTRKLDAETTAVLERHMEICPACREFSSAQRAVWEALDAWEAAPVTLDFDRRLYRRIEREVSWWELLVRPFGPVTMRQGLPIAAAAVMMVAGVMLDRQAAPTVSPARDTAQVEALQPDQVEHALDDMEMLGEFGRPMRADQSEPKM